jgi:hypothetical protein
MRIPDRLHVFAFGGVLAAFFIILPFFAIAYKLSPRFSKHMDELFDDDPLMGDDGI